MICDKNNKYLRSFVINHKNTINTIYLVIPGFRFSHICHVDRHGHFTLKQLRLPVLNESHTNSYTGPRLFANYSVYVNKPNVNLVPRVGPMFTLLTAFWTERNLICGRNLLQRKIPTVNNSSKSFSLLYKRLAFLAVTQSQFDTCWLKFRYDYRRFSTKPVCFAVSRFRGGKQAS
jgi:hypothetical protein